MVARRALPALMILAALLLSAVQSSSLDAQDADNQPEPVDQAQERERVWWPFMMQDLRLRGWPQKDKRLANELADGDRLIAIDGIVLRDNDHFITTLESYRAGDEIEVLAARRTPGDGEDAQPVERTISAKLALRGASEAYGRILEGERARYNEPEAIHPEWEGLWRNPWQQLVEQALAKRDASHETARLADAFDYAMDQIAGHFRLDEQYYLLRRPFNSEQWGRWVGDTLSGEESISKTIDFALRLSRVQAGELEELSSEAPALASEGDPFMLLIDAVLEQLDTIDEHYEAAFADLEEYERNDLFTSAIGFNPLEQKGDLERALEMSRRIDLDQLDLAIRRSARLAEWLAPDGAWHEHLLEHAPPPGTALDLPDGVHIGFRGDSTHEQSYRLLIDLGGWDTYETRRVKKAPFVPQASLILDLGNRDDDYDAKADASLGAGVLTSTILIDCGGDDTYRGDYNNLGCGVFGLGLLIDMEGNDRYLSKHNSQGTGLFGLGLIIDRAGNDRYDAHTFSQGVGYTRGVGLIIDDSGDDAYFATGHSPSPYGDEGEYMGFSQGCGFGFRPIGSGGIGAIIEGAGRDTYSVGQFGLGIGYFFGTGFVNDRGGDDVYRAARYGLGTSAHYGVGLVMDDAGNDNYYAMSVAEMAGTWDVSVGVLIDAAGDDVYRARSYALGAAAQNAYGLFWDKAGNDVYQAQGSDSALGYDGGWTYGAGRNARNLGVFLDSGGDDVYTMDGRSNDDWGIAEDKHYAIWQDTPFSAEMLARSVEAEKQIAELKALLEQHFSEQGTDATSMEELVEAGYLDSAQAVANRSYESYSWSGACADARFVGSIQAKAKSENPAPGVKVNFDHAGKRTIERTPATPASAPQPGTRSAP